MSRREGVKEWVVLKSYISLQRILGIVTKSLLIVINGISPPLFLKEAQTKNVCSIIIGGR